jgi:hypothetical protein
MNFSLLQAVTSWIQDALRLAPVHLPMISRPLELLTRAVASTSGLGLNDIWSSWTSSISPKSYIIELEQVASDADDSGEAYSEPPNHNRFGLSANPYSVLRSRLLEHIATRYTNISTTSSDLNPESVPVTTELEQVGPLRDMSPIKVSDNSSSAGLP